MSVHVMSWVFKQSDAKLGDRLVLLILADKAEDDGTNARPSVPTIAQQACLSERQVQRCLRNLEAAGQIEKTGRFRYPGQRHGVNIYRVIMPEAKGDILSAKGDIQDTQRVTPMSPNPSLEPIQDKPLAAAPQKTNGKVSKQQRDDVWDALTDIFGPVTTRTAETLRGKNVTELVNAGATGDEVRARAARWFLHFDVNPTAPAVVKHWDLLPQKPVKEVRR